MVLAEATSTLESLKSSGWFVYGSMAVLLLGYLATVSENLQKLLGPLGRWLGARQARRAARAASLTDVRIKDIQGQLDHVVPRLDYVERELYEMRLLATGHAPWDWRALNELRRNQPDYPDPPPLLPPPPHPLPSQEKRNP
ncbi:hypothetical protein [Umezawaea tangerina]|uniref:Uncharacterized protein n=1 Tax=Umezawaea tangerina TaxID=84725 RepID=A0A2T0SPJ2_9PSEU|nr:hypothetical protein [Umezawaea tangerina]PRY35341.1 hypothetical protein CLV43_114259 [Umezawaea tangerina]